MTTTSQQFITLSVPMLEEATAWLCEDCEEVAFEEPDYDKLYECGECNEKFRSANGGGRNGNMCPDCGNKFGTRVDEGEKDGSPICPTCDKQVCEEVTLDKCPIEGCDYHGEIGETNTDTYLRHFFEDHFDEMQYETPKVEPAVSAS